MSAPFPILLISPSCNISLPSTRDRQTWEGAEPRLACRRSVLGKYWAFKTRALKDSGCCSNLQACRASKARLNNSISRKPKPPINFGFDIVFQDTQAVFLSPFLLSHQNFRIRPFMCSHNPRGNLKHAIEYVGMAWATDLMSTSRPGWARNPSPPLQKSFRKAGLQVLKPALRHPSLRRWQAQVLVLKFISDDVQN